MKCPFCNSDIKDFVQSGFQKCPVCEQAFWVQIKGEQEGVVETQVRKGYHYINCPNCKTEIPIRAKLGSGTQRGRGMKLNENRKLILQVMADLKRPCTVRDVQAELRRLNQKRYSKRNTGWNYHTVQADLSNLLGGGHIEMVKTVQEKFDQEEGYTTNMYPLYRLVKKIEP